jgi:hypothetical protein
MSIVYFPALIRNVYGVSKPWTIVHPSIISYDLWNNGPTFVNNWMYFIIKCSEEYFNRRGRAQKSSEKNDTMKSLTICILHLASFD